MDSSSPGRQGPKKHRMDNSERDRLAMTAVELWCSFQEALAGTKRKYPLREFLSFADATRRYIDLTRHDQLVRRDVAEAVNGLTEFLRQERKRVPGKILFEADRLECLFFGGFDPNFEEDEPPDL
jgi:hypothetical protein